MSHKQDDSEEEYCHTKGGWDSKQDLAESKTPDFSDDELINKLQEYFFENDELSNLFESFVNKNCHIVDLNTAEYKLEYTKVFDDYKDLFERKMETYINDVLKTDVQKVYSALKSKVDNEDEFSSGAFFAQVLIAVTDFDVFMSMMRDAARNQNKK